MPACIRRHTIKPPAFTHIGSKSGCSSYGTHKRNARMGAGVRRGYGTLSPGLTAQPVSGTQLQMGQALGKAVESRSGSGSGSGNGSVKTVLYKTERFIPRVLEVRPPGGRSTSESESEGVKSLSFWQGVLKEGYGSLHGGQSRDVARVVVYGCDEYAGVEEVVTALVEEPFLDAEQRRRVRDRWKDVGVGVDDSVGENHAGRDSGSEKGRGSLIIRHGGSRSDEEPGVVHLDVPWLTQFAVPVELEEVRTVRSSSTSSSYPTTHGTTTTTALDTTKDIQKLFTADIPIVVLNPLTTPLHALLSPSSASTTSATLSEKYATLRLLLRTHANAILVLTTSPNVPHGTWGSLRRTVQGALGLRESSKAGSSATTGGHGVEVVLVDPVRAIGAVRALGMALGGEPEPERDSHSHSPSESERERRGVAVQRYQDDWTGSRVGELRELVRRKVLWASSSLASWEGKGQGTEKGKGKGKGDVRRVKEGTVREQVRASLGACEEVLGRAEREVGGVVEGVLAVRDEVAEVGVRVVGEVLRGGSGSGSEGAVREAVGKARREMEEVVGALSWWRAVSRVDEVGEVVRAGVERVWCRELEDRLIFHAGHLSASQKSLSQSTHALLSTHTPPSSPLHSPLLQNTLAQIQASSAYAIHPSSLTGPIHQRKAQLAYPIQALHAAAQGVALGTGGSVLGGLAIAWAGWAESLGVGLLAGTSGMGMGVETAVGVGMVVCVGGVRWMVGRWESAKRRWWRDWERVGGGLERDLKAALEKTVETQVTIVPRTASDALEKMVEKRREEIGELKDELEDLKREVEHSRPSV